MNLRDAQPSPIGWQARLDLRYSASAGERTVLSHRRHTGPLLVQKPFYPEGPRVCHSTLVHPPGGIAGGDRLELHVEVEAGAHAVITTPGAAKWVTPTSRRIRPTARLALQPDRSAGMTKRTFLVTGASKGLGRGKATGEYLLPDFAGRE